MTGSVLEKACAVVLRESEQLHGPGNALANAVMERWSECFRGNIKQWRQGDFHLVVTQTWPRVCVCVWMPPQSRGFIVVPQKQSWPSENGSQQQHRNRLTGCGQHREGCDRKDAQLNPTLTDRKQTILLKRGKALYNIPVYLSIHPSRCLTDFDAWLDHFACNAANDEGTFRSCEESDNITENQPSQSVFISETHTSDFGADASRIAPTLLHSCTETMQVAWMHGNHQ